MAHPSFFTTPGYGETIGDRLHYSQAVRIGDRVETSGQGGWYDDFSFPTTLEDEIRLAFENVERTLAGVGATWEQVVHVNSYHKVGPSDVEIGDDHNEIMAEQYRLRLGDRRPIWTQTGVTVFGLAAMRIEIRVTAIVPESHDSSS